MAPPELMRDKRERASYRVEYPIQERPELVIDGEPDKPVRVFDVSESGVRFVTRPDLDLSVGAVVSGDLRFRERASLAVRGEVIWIRSRSAALLLQDPIPFSTILDEQSYLRSRYHDPDV